MEVEEEVQVSIMDDFSSVAEWYVIIHTSPIHTNLYCHFEHVEVGVG